MVKLSASPDVADDIIDEQPSADTIAAIAQQRQIQLNGSLTTSFSLLLSEINTGIRRF